MESKSKRSLYVRYIFTAFLDNFIIALIVWSTFEISIALHFEFESWIWYKWWLFYSVLFAVGGCLIYLMPYFVEFLEELPQRVILAVQVKYSTNVKKLDKKLKQLKAEDKKDGFEYT